MFQSSDNYCTGNVCLTKFYSPMLPVGILLLYTIVDLSEMSQLSKVVVFV